MGSFPECSKSDLACVQTPPPPSFFPEGGGVCTRVKSDQHQFFPLDISP